MNKKCTHSVHQIKTHQAKIFAAKQVYFSVLTNGCYLGRVLYVTRAAEFMSVC